MARRCEICGRGPLTGNRVSHAHNLKRRRWNVNLRKLRVKVGGRQKRVQVCTRCIRDGRIQKVG